MMREHAFDLGRADVDAAGDDEILQPVDHAHAAGRRRSRRRRRCGTSRRCRARRSNERGRGGSRASPSHRARGSRRRHAIRTSAPAIGTPSSAKPPHVSESPYASTMCTPSPSARARSAGGHGAPPLITSRNSCSGAPASSSRRIVVGTSETIVVPSSRGDRATRSRSKLSCTVHGTPVTYERASAPRLATWCSGRHASHRSAGPACEPVGVAAAHHLHAGRVSSTPLGRPAVPLVTTIAAAPAGAGTPPAERRRRRRAWAGAGRAGWRSRSR